MREAPSLIIVAELIKRGARIRAFDPEAFEQAKHYLKDLDGKIEYIDDQYDTLDSCDALLLVTEWRQFRQPDFDILIKKLKEPVIFDGRNQYDPKHMREMGFEYFCIGR